jgi:hypothetical protein
MVKQKKNVMRLIFVASLEMIFSEEAKKLVECYQEEKKYAV